MNSQSRNKTYLHEPNPTNLTYYAIHFDAQERKCCLTLRLYRQTAITFWQKFHFAHKLPFIQDCFSFHSQPFCVQRCSGQMAFLQAVNKPQIAGSPSGSRSHGHEKRPHSEDTAGVDVKEKCSNVAWTNLSIWQRQFPFRKKMSFDCQTAKITFCIDRQVQIWR